MKISILEQNVVFGLKNILFYLLSSSDNRKRNSRNLYQDILIPAKVVWQHMAPAPPALYHLPWL